MTQEGNRVREERSTLEEIIKWTVHREREDTNLKSTWVHSLEPFDDELFSSYFTRILKLNFAEPIPTLRNLERETIVTNRYDIDRSIQPNTLNKIASFLNQNVDKLTDMCFFDRVKGKKYLFIIKDSKFCPSCLKEDDIPYYRFSWRLNFVSICPKHKCFLQDKCPECNSKVRYWDTKYNRPITECYKCGTDLTTTKVKEVEQEGVQIDKFIDFQNALIKASKHKQWKEKHIERIRFFLTIWTVAWSDYVLKRIESKKDYEDSIEKFIEKNQQSILKVFQAMYSVSKILDHYPERLEKPFFCPVDGNGFLTPVQYLRHIISHEEITCPLENCGYKHMTVNRSSVRCQRCGTEFKRDGTILKKGKLLNCPLNECGSNSITVKGKNYHCVICGTIFNTNGEIIKKGRKLKCPQDGCGSNNVRSYKSHYQCFICGTEFDPNGKIIINRERVNCPLESCQSTDINIRADGYKCHKCGTVFKKDGTIIKEGKRWAITCPVEGCGSQTIRLHKNHLSCYHCGAIFDFDMNILRRGKRLQCPLDECKSLRVRTNQRKDNRRICIQCGTEFDKNGKILKKGKKMICPNCNSKTIQAEVNSYVCDRCRTTFNIDGKIITKGITPKCPLSTCGSPLIQVRKRGSYIICRKCGTQFSFKGEILKKGTQKMCPICSSNWTYYNLQNRTSDSFLCMKCGSEFTMSNEILKRGESKNCTQCDSIRTHYLIKKRIYKCKQCNYEFK